MKGNKAIKVLHEIFHGFGRIRIDSDDTEPAKLSQLSQPRKQSTQPRHPKSHSGSKPIAQQNSKTRVKQIRGENGAKVSSTIPYPTQASSPASSPSKRGFTTSPSDAPHAEQCQGITKQAKRCTRRVKLDKVETGEDFHRFCHQHGKDILTQKGFFNKRGVWIEFDFWIPQQRLSTFTQIQLRLTMEKPIAHADVAGWIYVYSMPQTARHAEYKVGRTNNINRRIDNWSYIRHLQRIQVYSPIHYTAHNTQLHSVAAPSAILHPCAVGVVYCAILNSLTLMDVAIEEGRQRLLPLDNDDEENGLQAVVFADSFNSRFKPFTATKPRCLLPLVNVPMLAWTLESLAAAGIGHVFLFTCTHADQIKEWLRNSHFSSAHSTLTVTPIVSTTSVSAGDAIRELDAKQLIRTDFVLISGDVVSTVDIHRVVAEHKERRKSNKDAIMTMVVKRVGASHRLRPPAESPVFVISPENHQLHTYSTIAHPSTTKSATHKRISIPEESLEAVDVLLLFTENFDYQDLRHDFINGILTSDLLGKTIHVHAIEDEEGGYAARVMDSRSYDAISQDIISRWTYPMVPDECMPGSDRLLHHRGHRYYGKQGVNVAESARVGVCSVLGSHCTVAAHSTLDRSVLGQGVAVGENTQLSHSYIWNKTSIGSGCSIYQSIVADGVVIEDDVSLHTGCFVGHGVRLLKGTSLPPYTRVGSERWSEDSEADGSDEEHSNHLDKKRAAILGPSSTAYLWPSDKVDMEVEDVDSSDDDEEAALSMRYSRIGMSAGTAAAHSTSSLSTISGGESDESEEDDDELHHATDNLTLENAGKVGAAADFAHECTQSLERAFEEGHTSENAAIELKTLRMASNVPLGEVRKVVVDFCLSKVETEAGEGVQAYKAVEDVLGRWAPLVVEMTKEDQTHTVLLAQQFCAIHHASHANIFLAVLRALYEYEIVTEDAFFAWYKLDQARADGGIKSLWDKSRRFIEALLEAESESEESESE
ncbi:hypothetical protein E3P84_03074 [Wallemia ichthyophaga]|nr:hypothetical protein E3P84_03074 [Wallemia ichthyophaga]TIB40239.1 hypothetical protein E3P83_03017 [Wallemia ichthyophaga]